MKYITSLTKEDLNNNYVIFCEDENDFPCVLIKNSQDKIIGQTFQTDNMEFKTNTLLIKDEVTFHCHIIKSKKNDYISRQQFDVVSEYVFKKITKEISDNQLIELIDSLEEYFKVTPEVDKEKLQIGVFGELLTIKYLYDNDYQEILKKYHTNFYSKHDIEISQNLRLEIKTTGSEKRIHKFKHNQIYRTDIEVYVVSLLLEPAEAGTSLYELFREVISLYKDSDSIFTLEKLMKRCDVSEEKQGLMFSLNKAVEDIRLINSINVPRFNSPAPNGVTNVEYDSDCSLCQSINVKEFINVLRGKN